MPTYEYECRACGHTCEVFQRITETPKRKCPECGKQRLKRLIGAGAGFIFKGSGFYETDYRSAEYKRKAKADTSTTSSDKPSESSSPSKTGSGSESKSSGATKDAAGGDSGKGSKGSGGKDG